MKIYVLAEHALYERKTTMYKNHYKHIVFDTTEFKLKVKMKRSGAREMEMWEQITILNRVFWVGPFEKLTFVQRLGKGEEIIHKDLWERK